MKALKVEIPKGYEFESFDAKSSEIKLKTKPEGLPTTVEDLLEENGIYRTDFDEQCANLTSDEKAYVILKLLAKTLNQGWVPNWSDSSEYKYVPWFDMRGGSSGFRFYVCDYWYSLSDVGSRLCFKTRELAEHAGKYFVDTYRDFMVID
jgi:hypothetical protein